MSIQLDGALSDVREFHASVSDDGSDLDLAAQSLDVSTKARHAMIGAAFQP